GEAAVDNRRHHRLDRVEARPRDVVELVRDHVPRHRHGGDPVLACLRGRRGRRGECRDAPDRHERQREPPPHVTLTVACMNGWTRQYTWYVPAAAKFTAFEGG